jgi:hypothetical protein
MSTPSPTDHPYHSFRDKQPVHRSESGRVIGRPEADPLLDALRVMVDTSMHPLPDPGPRSRYRPGWSVPRR